MNITTETTTTRKHELGFTPEQIKRANAIARQAGHGAATRIVLGPEDAVIDHTSYGYRKFTTGEYVSNAYRAKFGWKNTYYQCAETTVQLKS